MPWPDARRYDAPGVSRRGAGRARWRHTTSCPGTAGPTSTLARSRLASLLAERLAGAGRTVAPRGETTLVSWEDADPEATRDRLFEAGIVVRNLPGTAYVRASVGAWNDESDLERLMAAL